MGGTDVELAVYTVRGNMGLQCSTSLVCGYSHETHIKVGALLIFRACHVIKNLKFH